MSTIAELRDLFSQIVIQDVRNIGNMAFLEQHKIIDKLNNAVHMHAIAGTEDLVLHATLSNSEVIGKLIHMLVVQEFWRANVFNHIISVVCDMSGLRSYIPVYTEVAISDLLSILTFHAPVISSGKEHIIELLEYCYRQIIRLNCSKKDSSLYGLPGLYDIEKIKSLTSEEHCELQSNETAFQASMAAIQILRNLITEHRVLTLSVKAKIMNTLDLPMALISLLEAAPWLRVHNNRYYAFENSKWEEVSKENLGDVPTVTASVWLMLFPLLVDSEFTTNYEITSYRRNMLTRAKNMLTPLLLAQIPSLQEIKRVLEMLSVSNTLQTGHSAVKATNISQTMMIDVIAPIREKLQKSWGGRGKVLADYALKKIFVKETSEELELLKDIVNVPMEYLLDPDDYNNKLRSEGVEAVIQGDQFKEIKIKRKKVDSISSQTQNHDDDKDSVHSLSPGWAKVDSTEALIEYPPSEHIGIENTTLKEQSSNNKNSVIVLSDDETESFQCLSNNTTYSTRDFIELDSSRSSLETSITNSTNDNTNFTTKSNDICNIHKTENNNLSSSEVSENNLRNVDIFSNSSNKNVNAVLYSTDSVHYYYDDKNKQSIAQRNEPELVSKETDLIKAVNTISNKIPTEETSPTAPKEETLTTSHMEETLTSPTVEIPPTAPKEETLTTSHMEETLTSPTVETLTISPTDETLTTSHVEETSTSAPTDETLTISPTDEILTASPTDEISTSAPTDETLTISPTDEILTASPTDEISTSAPTDETLTISPTDEILTASPTDEISTASDMAGISTASHMEETSTTESTYYLEKQSEVRPKSSIKDDRETNSNLNISYEENRPIITPEKKLYSCNKLNEDSISKDLSTTDIDFKESDISSTNKSSIDLNNLKSKINLYEPSIDLSTYENKSSSPVSNKQTDVEKELYTIYPKEMGQLKSRKEIKPYNSTQISSPQIPRINYLPQDVKISKTSSNTSPRETSLNKDTEIKITNNHNQNLYSSLDSINFPKTGESIGVENNKFTSINYNADSNSDKEESEPSSELKNITMPKINEEAEEDTNTMNNDISSDITNFENTIYTDEKKRMEQEEMDLVRSLFGSKIAKLYGASELDSKQRSGENNSDNILPQTISEEPLPSKTIHLNDNTYEFKYDLYNSQYSMKQEKNKSVTKEYNDYESNKSVKYQNQNVFLSNSTLDSNLDSNINLTDSIEDTDLSTVKSSKEVRIEPDKVDECKTLNDSDIKGNIEAISNLENSTINNCKPIPREKLTCAKQNISEMENILGLNKKPSETVIDSLRTTKHDKKETIKVTEIRSSNSKRKFGGGFLKKSSKKTSEPVVIDMNATNNQSELPNKTSDFKHIEYIKSSNSGLPSNINVITNDRNMIGKKTCTFVSTDSGISSNDKTVSCNKSELTISQDTLREEFRPVTNVPENKTEECLSTESRNVTTGNISIETNNSLSSLRVCNEVAENDSYEFKTPSETKQNNILEQESSYNDLYKPEINDIQNSNSSLVPNEKESFMQNEIISKIDLTSSKTSNIMIDKINENNIMLQNNEFQENLIKQSDTDIIQNPESNKNTESTVENHMNPVLRDSNKKVFQFEQDLIEEIFN